MHITVNNVNEAISEIFWRMNVANDVIMPRRSRNGEVLEFDEPVAITYLRPQQKVLFWPERNANPFFHCMEALHILGGGQDVAFLQQFNKNIAQFSDDGVVFNAPYGYRMRHTYGVDQLQEVIRLLARDPETRRAVIQLWDPQDLLRPSSKDHACNMTLVFSARRGPVDLTVYNRSNDIWWGAFGANAVQFGTLLEFVAGAVGRPVGRYHQITTNLHLYLDLYDAFRHIQNPPEPASYDYYRTRAYHYPILLAEDTAESFLECLPDFLADPYSTLPASAPAYLRHVAVPMARTYRAYKAGQLGADNQEWSYISALDWALAAQEWLERAAQKRLARRAVKRDNGGIAV